MLVERLRSPIWIFAGLALWLALGMGLRLPWPADEPRFVLMAQEMLLSGDWLLPHRGAELYAHKPPLFIWLIAASIGLVGNIKVAFLLPSLLAGIGTLGLVFDLCRRLYGPRAALATLLLLATTVQFVLQTKTAQVDMLLTFFITAGLYGLIRHWVLGPDWRCYTLAFVAMGFGCLTKFVGFLPLFMGLPLLYLCWKHPQQIHFKLGARTLLLPLVLLGPLMLWLIPVALRLAGETDPALENYFHELIVGQTLNRYAGDYGHHRPWHYYFSSVIPLFWLPWSLLLPFLALPWWRAMKRGEPTQILLLGFVTLVLLFYSITPSKRGVYILCCLPALSIAAAPHLQALWERVWPRRLLWGLVLLLSLLALIGSALPSKIYLHIRDFSEQTSLLLPLRLLLATLAAGLGLILWRLPASASRHAWPAAAMVLWSGYSLVGYPLLDPLRSPVATMAQIARQLPASAQLAIVNFREQHLLLADRPVTHFGFFSDKELQVQAAAHWLRAAPGRFVLVPGDKAQDCFDTSRGVALDTEARWQWVLLGADALRPECPSSALLQAYQAPWYGLMPPARSGLAAARNVRSEPAAH